MQIVHLIPPIISYENIKSKIICIRPGRAGGARVAAEKIGKQTIIHNYGHAGAGWTRLPGSAHIVKQLTDEHLHDAHKKAAIAVIGAGCMGLMSALTLHEAGYHVQIIAEKITDLTSDNAAGVWAPAYSKHTPLPQQELMDSLNIISLQYYQQILRGEHPFLQPPAAALLPAYTTIKAQMGLAEYVDRGYITPPREVLVDFGTGKQHELFEYQSIFINVPEMMLQLRKAVAARGIKIHQHKVTSFDELDSEVVVNCSGLEARKLSPNSRIFAEQGHLIELAHANPAGGAPYIIHAKIIQRHKLEFLYYTPRANGYLGVSFIKDEEGLNSNLHEFDLIMERAQDFFGT